MTFWQDARPASPRFRKPRGPRSARLWSRRRRRRALLLLAVLVASAGVSMVRADGERTARATVSSTPRHSTPRPSPPSTPTVIPERWSRTLPDWAAAMVQDHRDGAIVLSDNWVSSVALADGALRWQTSVPRVEPRAALIGDTVLLATETAFLALERTTGALRWLTETPETPGGVALVGPAGTPPVAVVSTAQGGLVGLDSRTGRVRWTSRLPGRVRGFFAADNGTGTIAAVCNDGATATKLRLIDAATGAVRWEQPLPALAGSPVIAGGIVAVGAGAGRDHSAVRAFALSDGKRRWRAPVAAPFFEDLVPLADGGDLYVLDQLGTMTRLALADGHRRWATRTDALETHVRPIRVDDAILFWNEMGEVVTLDRRRGAIRARRPATGLPIGLAVTPRFVVVAQRLVSRDAIQAFDVDSLVAPARSHR